MHSLLATGSLGPFLGCYDFSVTFLPKQISVDSFSYHLMFGRSNMASHENEKKAFEIKESGFKFNAPG